MASKRKSKGKGPVKVTSVATVSEQDDRKLLCHFIIALFTDNRLPCDDRGSFWKDTFNFQDRVASVLVRRIRAAIVKEDWDTAIGRAIAFAHHVVNGSGERSSNGKYWVRDSLTDEWHYPAVDVGVAVTGLDQDESELAKVRANELLVNPSMKLSFIVTEDTNISPPAVDKLHYMAQYKPRSDNTSEVVGSDDRGSTKALCGDEARQTPPSNLDEVSECNQQLFQDQPQSESSEDAVTSDDMDEYLEKETLLCSQIEQVFATPTHGDEAQQRFFDMVADLLSLIHWRNVNLGLVKTSEGDAAIGAAQGPKDESTNSGGTPHVLLDLEPAVGSESVKNITHPTEDDNAKATVVTKDAGRARADMDSHDRFFAPYSWKSDSFSSELASAGPVKEQEEASPVNRSENHGLSIVRQHIQDTPGVRSWVDGEWGTKVIDGIGLKDLRRQIAYLGRCVNPRIDENADPDIWVVYAIQSGWELRPPPAAEPPLESLRKLVREPINDLTNSLRIALTALTHICQQLDTDAFNKEHISMRAKELLGKSPQDIEDQLEVMLETLKFVCECPLPQPADMKAMQRIRHAILRCCLETLQVWAQKHQHSAREQQAWLAMLQGHDECSRLAADLGHDHLINNVEKLILGFRFDDFTEDERRNGAAERSSTMFGQGPTSRMKWRMREMAKRCWNMADWPQT